MVKLKRAIKGLMLLLLSVSFSLPLVACGNDSAEAEKTEDTMTSCGLYTKLTFTVDSGNGQVWATAENSLTILPSTVIVELELYRSETYKESYAEMSLADSKYSADLDQGETLTVTASTDGKESYWKVKMRYKIDRDKWEEQISETLLFGADGTRKEIVSKPVTEDKEYYVSDLLKTDAQIMQGIIWHTEYNNNARIRIADIFNFDKDILMDINSVVGKVKLIPYAFDTLEAKYYFLRGTFEPELKLSFVYSDGESISIAVNDISKKDIGINLYVSCIKNGVGKNFVSLIDDETKGILLDLVTKIYIGYKNK